MICEHLSALERELIEHEIHETARGQVWTDNCREWVYFDIVLDTDSLSERFNFPACVIIHENLDPKSGTERGFYCTECKDGIMGHLTGLRIYR